MFNDCYVEKVYNFSILRKTPKNFGGQLFSDAVGPISIVFYQKAKPEIESDRIAYYAPKTYVKSNIIESLIIDDTDLKYLPREECQKPDTKIWKIAMWGEINDWELINKLENQNETFKKYLKNNSFEYGTGLHPKENENNKILINGYHIETSKIHKYYTSKDRTKPIQAEFRGNNLKLFKHPLAIIKEGITDASILSSFFDFDVYYNKAVYGFVSQHKDKVKSISIIFNSDLAKYYFFLTSSSWGIERDRIVLVEYLRFPYLELSEVNEIKFIDTDFDGNNMLLNPKQNNFNKSFWQKRIAYLYGLERKDLILINDVIQYSIDLFYKQEYSKALCPVMENQIKEYAIMVTAELNDFISNNNLFANATIYSINSFTPLMVIKISHDKIKKDIFISTELIDEELKKIDTYLWDKKATNIYFKKKLNYSQGNNIYIIRPNQRRFWSKSQAFQDAAELILELLNGIHDES